MASEGGDSDNITKSTPTVGDDEVVASEGGDSDSTTPKVDKDEVVASEGGDSDKNTTSTLDDEVVASESGVSENISISAAGDDEVVASERGVSENISTSVAGEDEVVASERGVSENISTSAAGDNEVVASERGVSENISTSAAVDDEVVASEGRDSENISTSAVVNNDAVASEGGDSENISTSTVVDNEEDVKFGFKRSEMYTGKLKDSIKGSYDRHVFLCYKSYESWPDRVEDSEADPLPKLLAAAIKTRLADIKLKTRLTICEGLGGKLSDGDVLIFPDMIHYRDIKESNVDNFVEDVLVNGKPWTNGCKDVLTGSYVFICAHKKRDKRCGFCGPILVEKFKVEIESKGLKDNVFVIPCSHIGGHQYAGNAIIFSGNTKGKIEGHWYGYVTPNDVPKLLDQHIGKRQIIEEIWRGKMGPPAEKLFSSQLYNPEENKETTSGCCQGRSSCCRDGSSMDNLREEKVNKNGKSGGKEKGGRPSKWKRSGVVATVGVIGAVAAVVVIIGVCRRSK